MQTPSTSLHKSIKNKLAHITVLLIEKLEQDEIGMAQAKSIAQSLLVFFPEKATDEQYHDGLRKLQQLIDQLKTGRK